MRRRHGTVLKVSESSPIVERNVEAFDNAFEVKKGIGCNKARKMKHVADRAIFFTEFGIRDAVPGLNTSANGSYVQRLPG